MSSCSLLPLSDTKGEVYGLVLRSPRLVARAESPVLPNVLVDIAHLEFLRMTEVTESISDKRMCLRDTEGANNGPVKGFDGDMVVKTREVTDEPRPSLSRRENVSLSAEALC